MSCVPGIHDTKPHLQDSQSESRSLPPDVSQSVSPFTGESKNLPPEVWFGHSGSSRLTLYFVGPLVHRNQGRQEYRLDTS